MNPIWRVRRAIRLLAYITGWNVGFFIAFIVGGEEVMAKMEEAFERRKGGAK